MTSNSCGQAAKVAHAQRTKREQSKLQVRLERKKSRSNANLALQPEPEQPGGRVVVLQLSGGLDKQRKGPAAGHRRDTFALCNAITQSQWSCRPLIYDDASHDAIAQACAAADAVIVRACSGSHEGVSANKLRGLLRELLAQVIPPVLSLFTLLRPYLAHFFPVFSRFLCVFTAWPRRFQRAPSRNPGPRNSRHGDQEGRNPPFVRHAWR